MNEPRQGSENGWHETDHASHPHHHGENHHYTDDDETTPPPSKPWFLRIVAVVCLLAFASLALPNMTLLLQGLPPFLNQSRVLSSQELVTQSLPAIVQVEATQVNDLLSSTRQQGTGFNIQPTGLVVTNQHVVGKAREVKISFTDGRTFYSQKIKPVAGLDLALIELQGQNLPSLKIDTDKAPEKAADLMIVGNPQGYEGVPVRGPLVNYVSVPNMSSPIMLIQAIVAPGNSGSPVLNPQGQVVGVIFASTGDPEKGTGQALAIPLEGLKDVLAGTVLP